jgi:hypothetical protein
MRLCLLLGLLVFTSAAASGCSKTGSGRPGDASTLTDGSSGTGGNFADGGSRGGGTAGNLGGGGVTGVVLGGTGNGGSGGGGLDLSGASVGGGGGGGGGGNVTGTIAATGGITNGGSGSDAGVGTGGTSGLACPGVTPWPAGYQLCRTQNDCPTSYVCKDTEPYVFMCPPYYCSSPVPSRQCTVDTDCGPNGICVSGPTDACCPEISSRCVTACTTKSCLADERCGTKGLCEPNPCSAGFVCTGQTLCAPTRAGADSHGCALMGCNEGYTCPSDMRCQAGAPGADNRGCVFASCTDVPCPMNYTCQPSSSARGCVPKSCASDSDCDCGACIRMAAQGQCAGQPYRCTAISYGGSVASMGGSGTGGMVGTQASGGATGNSTVTGDASTGSSHDGGYLLQP